MPANQPRSLELYTLALIGLVAYGGLLSVHLRYGTLRAGHTPETLAWYGLAYLAYIIAIIWVERTGRFSWRLVWGAAVLFRLLLLFTQPTLSDDIYRYIWDGYVSNNDVSPYTYAIEDPALDYLDIAQRAQANNTWMASPYLPAAQIVFATLTRISTLTGLFPLQAIWFQIAAVLFDLLSAWLIGRLLTLAHLPPRRILLYLWNPLIIVETAHGAHLDALMVLLTLLSLHLTLTQLPITNQPINHSTNTAQFTIHNSQFTIHYLLPPLLLALATLTKILPILLLPILIWCWRWRQTIFYVAMSIILLIPSGIKAGWGLSGPLDGRGLFGALRIYNDSWNFNSGLFHWLEQFLTNTSLADPNLWAKRVMATLMLLVLSALFLLARRSRSPRATLRLSAIPFLAYILLTTTVHPWYIHILLAFLPFLPPVEQFGKLLGWLPTTPWLYLTATLPLSYLTYINPQNYREFEWIRQIEWLPVLAIISLSIFTNHTILRHRHPKSR